MHCCSLSTRGQERPTHGAQMVSTAPPLPGLDVQGSPGTLQVPRPKSLCPPKDRLYPGPSGVWQGLGLGCPKQEALAKGSASWFAAAGPQGQLHLCSGTPLTRPCTGGPRSQGWALAEAEPPIHCCWGHDGGWRVVPSSDKDKGCLLALPLRLPDWGGHEAPRPRSGRPWTCSAQVGCRSTGGPRTVALGLEGVTEARAAGQWRRWGGHGALSRAACAAGAVTVARVRQPPVCA